MPTLTANIVAAHVSNSIVAVSDVAALIAQVRSVLTGLGVPTAPETAALTPAVPVRSSVKSDFIVCHKDGRKLKMLGRYLMTKYQMTLDDYRPKWNLPKDYTMVAPNCA